MGSFSLAHIQIIIFFSIFIFVVLILFNKNPERKKILYGGLVVSFLLAFLSSASRPSASSGKEEQALKAAFAVSCQSVRQISNMTAILGQNRIDSLCSCAYDETLKSVSKGEMKIALSPGAGLIEPEVAKLSQFSQLAIASCLQNLDVPPNAKGITTSAAEVIKAQVEVQKAWSKSIGK